MEINLPINVRIVLDALHNSGYLAYVVGGCVRDSILGKEPKDWDVTTSARPEQIIEVFKGYEVIPTGLQHGTVTIVVGGMPIECTTFRVEGCYTDGRHPDNVMFALSVEDDLMRRDFRMNAIAYNPWHGLVDVYNGIKDLDNKVICCMGNPYNRFNEDGLRILRAIRFAAQLGFEIENETSNAIHDCKHLLDNISKERIQSELCKILMSEQCGSALFALYYDVFKMLLPYTRISFGKRFTMSKVTSSNENGNDIVSRLTLLFDGDSSDTVYKNLKELKFGNGVITCVTQLVNHCNDPLPLNKHEMKLLMSKLNTEQMNRLIFINKCKAKRAGEESSEFADVLRAKCLFDEVISNGECYSLKQLKINGNDLMDRGVPQGKDVGNMLNRILDMVINEQLENDRAALLEMADEMIGG